MSAGHGERRFVDAFPMLDGRRLVFHGHQPSIGVVASSTSSAAHFRLNVGGCSVRFDTQGPMWGDALADLAFDWRDEEGGPAAGQIRCGFDLGPPPPGPPEIDDGDVRVWTTVGAPQILLGGIGLRMPDADTVIIGGDPEVASTALGRAIPLALAWVLAGADSWVVHSGAFLAGADGAAVLAVGPTGSGKSTTAAAALRAGWPVLGDDLVAVRWNRGDAEVRGIPRPLCVPAELDDWSESGRPLVGDARGRWAITPQLASGWFPLRVVIVLAHGSTPDTRLEKLGAIDALRALWSAHFPAAIPSRLERWFPRAARLARLPAWRMHLGTDAQSRLTTTAEALGSVIASEMPTPP